VRISPRLRIAAACVLSCLAALVTTAPAGASRTDCVPEAGWPAQDPGLAAQVVDLVNAHRARLGLPLVGVSQSLTNAAAWKASELAYDVATAGEPAFTHQDYLTGRTPAQRLQACGWSATFGENIAFGQRTAQDVMTAWLNSTTGHRENIENPAWVAIGVGAAPSASGTGWVQEFSSTLPDPISAPTASLLPPAPSPTTPTVAGPLPPPIEAVSASAPAVAAPGLTIMDRPRSRTRRRTARIRWSISGVAHGVSCTLNGRTLQRCGTTGRTLRVRRGRHVLRVTVTGPSGSDTERIRWRVLRRR
jgi:uncharacterized protein YkwD